MPAESPSLRVVMAARIIAVASTLVVVTVLWMPPPEVSRFDFPGMDLLIHFVLFLLASVAWSWAGLGPVTAIGGAALLALATELGQGFLPWPRTPEGLDAAADVVGAVFGVLAWRRFGSRRN